MRIGASKAFSTIISLPVTLIGLVTVTFFISRVVPIDPVLAIAGDHAAPAMVEEMRGQLGLDQPLYIQYGIYLGRLLHGDLGSSVMSSRTVVEDLATFFPATFELSAVAFFLSVLVGVPIGVISAFYQNSLFDHLARIVCTITQSVPVFAIGLIGLLVFYVKLGLAPGSGRADVIFEGLVQNRTGFLTIDALLAGQWDAAEDAFAHLMLPASVLALFSLTHIARMTRAFMLDVLSEDFMVAAEAKGLSDFRMVWGHAFNNIKGNLVTVLALSFANLLEGAIATETVFSWPGLGNYLTVSLLNADMNAVLGATLVIGVVYLVLNLVADLVAALTDPRIK